MKHYINTMRWLCIALACMMAAVNANAYTERFSSINAFGLSIPPVLGSSVSVSTTTASSYKNFATLSFDPYQTNTTAITGSYTIAVNYKAYQTTVTTGTPAYTGTINVNYNSAAGANSQLRTTFQLPATTSPTLVLVVTGYTVVQNGVTTLTSTTTPSLGNITAKMQFFAEIEVERYAPINTLLTIPVANKPKISTATDGTNDIRVDWAALTGAEQYELEWIYIDDYSGVSINSVTGFATASYIPLLANVPPANIRFKDNATRVLISGGVTSYTIPKLYEHGYLFFRIRGVGITSAIDKTPVFSRWSEEDAATGIPPANFNYTTLIPAAVGYFYNDGTVNGIPNVHETTKNWQAVTSYAEEGKRKDVITYMDGTMRARQSVTGFKQEIRSGLYNSERMALVGESFYDQQGRATVTAMPVPAYSPVLKYYANFNSSAANLTAGAVQKPYSWLDFDIDPITGTCDKIAKPMSSNNLGAAIGLGNTSTGAANYYSPNNRLLAAVTGTPSVPLRTEHDFLADATGSTINAGFPFTQVEYMPDNTGRIRRQGGVGENHQIGSGHETKYQYSTPTQPELDKLFGTDAGDASHYQKTTMTDPNGQISLTYTNMLGKTVATALVGKPDQAALEPLTSAPGAPSTIPTIDLYAGNVNETDYSITAENTFDIAALVGGTYAVTYSLATAQYSTTTCPNVCATCAYDLEITLRNNDACPSPTPWATPTPGITTTAGFTNSNPLTNGTGSISFVASGGGAFVYTQHLGQVLPATGVSCNVGFTYLPAATPLTINFTNLPKGNYTLTKKLKVDQSVVNAQVEAMADACPLNLQTFITAAETNIGITRVNGVITTPTCETLCDKCALIYSSPNPNPADKDRCDMFCKKVPSLCQSVYDMMVGDMQVGAGQYASDKVDAAGAISDKLSFLHANTLLPRPTGVVAGAVFSTPAAALVNPLGSATPNYTFTTVPNLIRDWQPSWAKQYVQYHPEYPIYENTCTNKNTASAAWMNSDAFDANLRGNATPAYTTTTNPLVNTAGLVNITNDPYFFANTVDATTMNAKIANFYPSTIISNPTTMVEAAINVAELSMGGLTSLPTDGTALHPFNYYAPGGTAPNAEKDARYWSTFVSIYLGEKERLQFAARMAIANTNGANNQCIGKSVGGCTTNSAIPSGRASAPCTSAAGGVCTEYATKTRRFPDRYQIMTAASAQYDWASLSPPAPNNADLTATIGNDPYGNITGTHIANLAAQVAAVPSSNTETCCADAPEFMRFMNYLASTGFRQTPAAGQTQGLYVIDEFGVYENDVMDLAFTGNNIPITAISISAFSNILCTVRFNSISSSPAFHDVYTLTADALATNVDFTDVIGFDNFKRNGTVTGGLYTMDAIRNTKINGTNTKFKVNITIPSNFKMVNLCDLLKVPRRTLGSCLEADNTSSLLKKIFEYLNLNDVSPVTTPISQVITLTALNGTGVNFVDYSIPFAQLFGQTAKEVVLTVVSRTIFQGRVQHNIKVEARDISHSLTGIQRKFQLLGTVNGVQTIKRITPIKPFQTNNWSILVVLSDNMAYHVFIHDIAENINYGSPLLTFCTSTFPCTPNNIYQITWNIIGGIVTDNSLPNFYGTGFNKERITVLSPTSRKYEVLNNANIVSPNSMVFTSATGTALPLSIWVNLATGIDWNYYFYENGVWKVYLIENNANATRHLVTITPSSGLNFCAPYNYYNRTATTHLPEDISTLPLPPPAGLQAGPASHVPMSRVRYPILAMTR
jgi:hypothetical protein